MRSWSAISTASTSGLSRYWAARASSVASGRKVPSRSGAKPALSGANGAVSVTCKPMAMRRSPELRLASESASVRWKLGAVTMTVVALMRPRARRSRIAVLTEAEIP